MSDKNQPDKSSFPGALADQLDDLDIEPADPETGEEVDDQANQAQPTAADPPKNAAGRDDLPNSAPGVSGDRRPVGPGADRDPGRCAGGPSDRELFERAVDQIDPDDMYGGKYGGGDEPDRVPDQPTSAESPPPESSASQSSGDREVIDERQARRDIADQRAIRQFERAIGPVNRRRDDGKHRPKRKPRPADHARHVVAERSDSTADMITPPLPKSGVGLTEVTPLSGSQKDMLGRHEKHERSHDTPETSVRGSSVREALGQVESFVHQQFTQHRRFVRIIHGRGLQSVDQPVLKPAVLRWLEGAGSRYVRGYVPEVTAGGDYGSVITELVQPDGDP